VGDVYNNGAKMWCDRIESDGCPSVHVLRTGDDPLGEELSVVDADS
jgi:hypothetical protein